MASDKQLKAVIADLTPEEVSRLPARLRKLDRPEHLDAWNAAKAERDERLAELMIKVQDEREDGFGNTYYVEVERYRDPETGPAEAERIKADWQARKKELLAAQKAED